MDIYGERYAEVGLFIDYCRDLNIKTDERELAYYEKTGAMLPVARVIYPDEHVIESYRRELDGDYNWNGFDVWPELSDLTEKFRPFLRQVQRPYRRGTGSLFRPRHGRGRKSLSARTGPGRLQALGGIRGSAP